MIVRDIIRQAYANGDLQELLDGRRWLTARFCIEEALALSDEEVAEDCWKTVVIPFGRATEPELICMFRDHFTERFTPVCREDVVRLGEEKIPSDERAYLRLRVARRLLMSHDSLFKCPRLGPNAYGLLLSAQVPEPVEDPAAFAKAFLLQVGWLPEDGDCSVRVIDPIGRAVAVETALVKAHMWFLHHSPKYDEDQIAFAQEVLAMPRTTPVILSSKNGEVRRRVADELMELALDRGQSAAKVRASALSGLSDRELMDLCGYQQLFVTDFATLLVDSDAEKNLETLIGDGVRLVFLTDEDELPVFDSEELTKRFAIAYRLDID